MHDRTFPVLELTGLHVENSRAGNIRRKGIGGELDASELQSGGTRQNPRESSLADAGHVFKEHMAAGQKAYQNIVRHVSFADEDTVNFISQFVYHSILPNVYCSFVQYTMQK